MANPEDRQRLGKSATDEIRKSAAQYCNSLSVACFVVGCLSPAFRLAERRDPFSPDLGLVQGVARYLVTDAGLLSAALMVAAALLRLRAIHVLSGLPDRDR